MCCSQLRLCSRRHNAPISEQRLRGQEQEKDVVLPSLEAILVLLCEHLPVHIKQRNTTPRPPQAPSLCFKVARTLHRLQASLRKRLSQDEMANPRNRGQSGDRGLYHVLPGQNSPSSKHSSGYYIQSIRQFNTALSNSRQIPAPYHRTLKDGHYGSQHPKELTAYPGARFLPNERSQPE